MRNLGPKPFMFRYGLSAVMLLAYLGFAALYRANGAAYQQLQAALMVAEPHPFGDLGAILQAGICWRHGVDVYLPNACMHGGNYNYAPVLLKIGDLPISPADQYGIGIIIGLFFICFMSLLPPCTNAVEFFIRLAVLLSPTVIFALERANLDTVLLLITIISLFLLLRGQVLRLAGYGLVLLMAAVKFYPVVLLALALRESRRTLIGLTMVAIIFAAFFVWHYLGALKTAFAILPHGPPFLNFGVFNLPFGLADLTHPPSLANNARVTAFCNFAAFGMFAITFAVAVCNARHYQALLRGLESRMQIMLVAAALVIVACYFIAQNIDYRAVFLIPALPSLTHMAAKTSGRNREFLIFTQFSIIIVMWEYFIRTAFLALPAALGGPLWLMFWLFRELLWWGIIMQLSVILAAYCRSQLIRLAGES